MRPLDDLIVLDLSRVLSGPYCTMALADMGARVIKIEQPGTGDDTRRFGPPFIAGESSYFLSVNRGKQSVALDIKSPEGKAALLALVDQADVLVENFRPGVLDRLGFSWQACHARNPKLIYCSISGFGHYGLPEWRAKPGYDLVLQGMGGLQGLTGPAGGEPFKVGTSIADLVTGMLAFQGILLALIARGRTGRGQHVDIAMLDGQVSLLTYQAGIYFATGQVPTRMGNRHPSIAPYETYQAADGFLNLAVGNDGLWKAFTQAAGEAALGADARFATNRDRVANRDALAAAMTPLMKRHTVARWVQMLEAAGVPCGPILGLDQVLEHPQVKARQMVVELEHPTAGQIRVTGVPMRLSETPGGIASPPPTLGEHTEQVLAGLASAGQGEPTGR